MVANIPFSRNFQGIVLTGGFVESKSRTSSLGRAAGDGSEEFEAFDTVVRFQYRFQKESSCHDRANR